MRSIWQIIAAIARLFAEQIKAWRMACDLANDWDRASTVRLGQATKEEKKRIKDLERELARKDRALARSRSASGSRQKRRQRSGGVRRGPATQDQTVRGTV